MVQKSHCLTLIKLCGWNIISQTSRSPKTAEKKIKPQSMKQREKIKMKHEMVLLNPGWRNFVLHKVCSCTMHASNTGWAWDPFCPLPNIEPQPSAAMLNSERMNVQFRLGSLGDLVWVLIGKRCNSSKHISSAEEATYIARSPLNVLCGCLYTTLVGQPWYPYWTLRAAWAQPL